MPRKSCIALIAVALLLPLVAHADPQYFKKPYYMEQIPTITGTVESVTDHSFSLVTDAGEHLSFETDSRTLLPAKFGPESRVWLEYSLMENGDHHATRVSGLGTGTLATANTYQEEPPQAESMEPPAEPVAMEEPQPAQPAPVAEPEPAHELPTTASPWPLAQLIGAMALSSGVTMWFTRRRRPA